MALSFRRDKNGKWRKMMPRLLSLRPALSPSPARSFPLFYAPRLRRRRRQHICKEMAAFLPSFLSSSSTSVRMAPFLPSFPRLAPPPYSYTCARVCAVHRSCGPGEAGRPAENMCRLSNARNVRDRSRAQEYAEGTKKEPTHP